MGNYKKKQFLNFIKDKLRRNELGKKYDDFKRGKAPYIKPPLDEPDQNKENYIFRNKDSYRSYDEKFITDCKIIKRRKLYGFDGGKEYRFILIKFKNIGTFYRVRDLWYTHVRDKTELFGRKSTLNKLKVMGINTELYEAKLPSLLRFFHIREISPSGWIRISRNKILKCEEKNTNCDFEYMVNFKDIVPLAHKEKTVPIKVCSFDIEASSSHGDFPVPKKHYRKWISDIISYWGKHRQEIRKMVPSYQKKILLRMIYTAFGYDNFPNINMVYPKWNKENINKEIVKERFAPFLRESLYKIIVETKRPAKKESLHLKKIMKEMMKKILMIS